jgi:hypothetical protein
MKVDECDIPEEGVLFLLPLYNGRRDWIPVSKGISIDRSEME